MATEMYLSVYAADTNEYLGEATERLARESLAAGDTGIVSAYHGQNGLWYWLADEWAADTAWLYDQRIDAVVAVYVREETREGVE